MLPIPTAIVLTVVLAVLFALLWIIERTFFPNRLQSIGWQAGLIIAFVIILIDGGIGLVVYRSQGWPAVILLAITLLGCVANWIMEAIENKPDGQELKLEVYKLLKPMIVSPILFAAVISALTGNTDGATTTEEGSGPINFAVLAKDIAPFVVAFQNGYFWQAIIERAKPTAP